MPHIVMKVKVQKKPCEVDMQNIVKYVYAIIWKCVIHTKLKFWRFSMYKKNHGQILLVKKNMNA